MRVGLRKKSILIVEDNYNVLSALAQLAGTLGFDVATAASRREARGLIDQQAFDVAIVDMRLVEGDTRNRDGVAIIKYLGDKNEGTKSIFLTGYGGFGDAREAAFDLHVFDAIEKHDPDMEEKIRNALFRTANPEPQDKYKSSVSIWCGTDDPVQWGTRMSGLLKPSGGIQVLNSVLDDLAKTLHPLFRRSSDNGIQKTDDALATGLYWSRGVGAPVIVAISRGEVPSPLPLSDQWPKDLRTVDQPLYEVKRKNLSAAVIKCEGIDNTEFDVACAYRE